MYACIATLILTTCLLLVASILVIAEKFPADDHYWRVVNSGNPISERFVPEHYYLIDKEEVREVQKEFDRFGFKGQYVVDPWTGLTNSPFEGKHLNIINNGERKTITTWTDPSKPRLRVWAFGGSTLFGWGVSDKFTVASLLNQELSKQLPETNVLVRNFAAPYFNTSQELSIFYSSFEV